MERSRGFHCAYTIMNNRYWPIALVRLMKVKNCHRCLVAIQEFRLNGKSGSFFLVQLLLILAITKRAFSWVPL